MTHTQMLAIGCAAILFLPPLLLAGIVSFTALVLNPRTGAATDYHTSALLSATPPPLIEPTTLKIVTFNIACAYLFTSNRPERMREIGRVLTELDPDIVGIQESFVAKDREILLEALSESRLQYHADYPAATVGNGLLTLSAYPIVENYFHRFRVNNPWYKMHQGDWWAGKGVGLARILLPDGAVVDFYNTHAQAGRGDAANAAVRFEQMGELAAFMNQSRTGVGPAFIVGDFNTRMGRSDLERAMSEAGLLCAMTIESGIDFIFAAEDKRYNVETLDTIAITGETRGSKGALFLSRAPTPRELWRILFGPGEMTTLSDHKGFMSTIRIHPQ